MTPKAKEMRRQFLTAAFFHLSVDDRVEDPEAIYDSLAKTGLSPGELDAIEEDRRQVVAIQASLDELQDDPDGVYTAFVQRAQDAQERSAAENAVYTDWPGTSELFLREVLESIDREPDPNPPSNKLPSQRKYLEKVQRDYEASLAALRDGIEGLQARGRRRKPQLKQIASYLKLLEKK